MDDYPYDLGPYTRKITALTRPPNCGSSAG
jgi:hypothetical protein